MKKCTRFILLLLGISLFSCTTDNSPLSDLSKEETSSTLSLELTSDQNSLLKSKAHFSSYEIINLENNEFILSRIEQSDIYKQCGVDMNNLDLLKVAKVEWIEYNKVAYILKEKTRDSYYTIVLNTDNSLKNNDQENYSFNFLIDSDSNGTGSLYFESIYEKRIAYFNNGNLVKEESSISTKDGFRQCFDESYDAICDGFIGCLAWYSNPPVPIVTAVYCAVVS